MIEGPSIARQTTSARLCLFVGDDGCCDILVDISCSAFRRMKVFCACERKHEKRGGKRRPNSVTGLSDFDVSIYK